MNSSLREAAAGLLQVQADLHRLLRQRPETREERRAWRAGVTTALIEGARGRLYLARLTSGPAAWQDVAEGCPAEERLAG